MIFINKGRIKMGYRSDREFTEYIHKTIALKKIYEPLGWKEESIDPKVAKESDIFEGIDRWFRMKDGNLITVQERFRDKSYFEHNDFTIRYKRDNNLHLDRKRSEFFKIEADYFVYGITNCSKNNKESCFDFIKFAIIDMKLIKDLIEKGLIIIDENFKRKTCVFKEGKMFCPVIENNDKSSSFIPIDIKQLKQFKNYKQIVISQKGYLE